MNLTELTWTDVDRIDRNTPVVFPIAAMEQHGHHMPLFTDSMLLGEIVRRLQEHSIAQRVLFAPLQWLGNSHHHADMPGTISADPRLYLDLLRNLAENFLDHQFRRILFLNGHGGNIVPAQQAIFELRQKYRVRTDLLLLSLTYWQAASHEITDITMSQTEMGHACEWETSMMLALRPELVAKNIAQIEEVPFGSGAAPGFRGWTMPDRTRPGHIGHPGVARREKGDALFRHFTDGVATYLERVVAWDGSRWEL